MDVDASIGVGALVGVAVGVDVGVGVGEHTTRTRFACVSLFALSVPKEAR